MNTASLVTYGRIYEILLILQKDTRRAKVILELDLGAVPAPITEIKCINDELCFPRFGGVFVNPTARLALKGTCTEECKGDETYTWEIYRDKAPTTLNTVSIAYYYFVGRIMFFPRIKDIITTLRTIE